MSEHMEPIPSRLYNAAVGGHVAGADQIIDDETGLTLDKVTGGALEEKTYTSGSNNGMGRVVLRKNLVNGVNTLVQTMINKSNTIYVIQYDFTLGEDITVPANCVLEFEGGSLSNGTIKLSNTEISANLYRIFSGVVFTDDSILLNNWHTIWSLDNTNNEDTTAGFNNLILLCSTSKVRLIVDSGSYRVTAPLRIRTNTYLQGEVNSAKSGIKQASTIVWDGKTYTDETSDDPSVDVIVANNYENYDEQQKDNNRIYNAVIENIFVEGSRKARYCLNFSSFSKSKFKNLFLRCPKRAFAFADSCIFGSWTTPAAYNTFYDLDCWAENDEEHILDYGVLLDTEVNATTFIGGRVTAARYGVGILERYVNGTKIGGSNQNCFVNFVIEGCDNGVHLTTEFNTFMSCRFEGIGKRLNDEVNKGHMVYYGDGDIHARGNAFINPTYYNGAYANYWNVRNELDVFIGRIFDFDVRNFMNYFYNIFTDTIRCKKLISDNVITVDQPIASKGLQLTTPGSLASYIRYFFENSNERVVNATLYADDESRYALRLKIYDTNGEFNGDIFSVFLNGDTAFKGHLELLNPDNSKVVLYIKNDQSRTLNFTIGSSPSNDSIRFSCYDTLNEWTNNNILDIIPKWQKFLFNFFIHLREITPANAEALTSWMYEGLFKNNVNNGNLNLIYYYFHGKAEAVLTNLKGTTRPDLSTYDIGRIHFHTNDNKPSWWNGTKWVDATGIVAGTQTSGTFANKPTVASNSIPVGFAYFCTDKQTTEGATNGIMIYHKGNNVWVDALGRVVS